MKIDKKTLDKISTMPDDKLWSIICALGASTGVDLTDVKFQKGQLDKVRLALNNLTDDDIVRAGEIIENCKAKGGGNV